MLSKAAQNRVDRLRPYHFKPGKSGNPLGPGYNALTMAKIIREKSGYGAELATFFFRIMRGEAIDLKARTRSHIPTLDQRISAAVWLADRGWGKAKETIELTGEATTSQRLEILKRLSDDERSQLRDLLAKALAAEQPPIIDVTPESAANPPGDVDPPSADQTFLGQAELEPEPESNDASIPVESSSGETAAPRPPLPSIAENEEAEKSF